MCLISEHAIVGLHVKGPMASVNRGVGASMLPASALACAQVLGNSLHAPPASFLSDLRAQYLTWDLDDTLGDVAAYGG